MAAISCKTPIKGKINRYIKRVIKRLKPKLIVIYGSVATKSYGVGSDIDMLVISDNFPKNFLERMKILYELNIENAPIDVIGYTAHEFKKMITKLHPTALSALMEGIPIYNEGFYEEAKTTLSQTKLKIVKTESGWEIIK